MVLLTPGNFRLESINEACVQLDLTTAEAPDATLTPTIARLTRRIEDWTHDRFESSTVTLTLDGTGRDRIYLPLRCTAVTSVTLVDTDGTVALQPATSYRLHSSLYEAGSLKLGDLDYIVVTPVTAGLTSTNYSWNPYVWPKGTGTVRVVGMFGWVTPPTEIKRALALLVYDHFKTKRHDLRVAESVQSSTTVVRYAQPDPANGIWSGIQEVDLVIAEYRREPTMAA